ncbi:hypothetical protein [Nocardia sp.]|uniref:hypothetical protein n=1 Tax=Nocardia sp. TaxID=1821 RepID=UPI0026051BBA|nr:hypothetical protein [Nocardia sp.]
MMRHMVAWSGRTVGQISKYSGIPRSTAYHFVCPTNAVLPRKRGQVQSFAQACKLSPTQITTVVNIWEELSQLPPTPRTHQATDIEQVTVAVTAPETATSGGPVADKLRARRSLLSRGAGSFKRLFSGARERYESNALLGLIALAFWAGSDAHEVGSFGEVSKFDPPLLVAVLVALTLTGVYLARRMAAMATIASVCLRVAGSLVIADAAAVSVAGIHGTGVRFVVTFVGALPGALLWAALLDWRGVFSVVRRTPSLLVAVTFLSVAIGFDASLPLDREGTDWLSTMAVVIGWVFAVLLFLFDKIVVGRPLVAWTDETVAMTDDGQISTSREVCRHRCRNRRRDSALTDVTAEETLQS